MACSRTIPTIAIVVDDEAIRDSLHLLLECEGFAIHEFSSVAHYLAECGCLSCDCLILDLEASDKAVLERFRDRAVGMPTILVTDAARSRFAPALSPASAGFIVLEKPGGYQGIGGLVRATVARGPAAGV